MRGSRFLKQSLILAVLSPMIAEFLTGSTSLFIFFPNPLIGCVGFLFLLAGYGGGVLLVREVSVITGRGWGAILPLGAAYGILEEGFGVHTFFQPYGHPVWAMGQYGRVFGINWTWAVGLSIFHSIYSIALPILLINLAYPETAGKRFLGKTGIVICLASLLGAYLFVGLTTPYAPDFAQSVFFLIVIIFLALIALKLPERFFIPRTHEPARNRRFFMMVSSVPLFYWLLTLTILVSVNFPAVIATGLDLVVCFLCAGSILKNIGIAGNHKQVMGVAWGLLIPLFSFDIIEATWYPEVLLVTFFFIMYLRSLGRKGSDVINGSTGIP